MKTYNMEPGKIYAQKNFHYLTLKDGKPAYVIGDQWGFVNMRSNMEKNFLEVNPPQEIKDVKAFVFENHDERMPQWSVAHMLYDITQAQVLAGIREPGKSVQEIAEEYGIEKPDASEFELFMVANAGTVDTSWDND